MLTGIVVISHYKVDSDRNSADITPLSNQYRRQGQT